MATRTFKFLFLSLFSANSLFAQVSPYVFSEAQFPTGATPYSVAALSLPWRLIGSVLGESVDDAQAKAQGENGE